MRPEHDGMRLQIRTPGDLESMELVAFDRIPPGPGRSRSRSPPPASTSPTCWSPSAATRASRDDLPQLGTDFAGVVTRGRARRHRRTGSGTTSAGISANGCWGTFVTCDARLAVTLPAATDRRAGRRDDHRARHGLVRPARSGQDRAGVTRC